MKRLLNEEYNMLMHLTHENKQDFWFDIREDDNGNDYVYDLENNVEFELLNGLDLLFDGITIDDLEFLSQEEQEILWNLINKVKGELSNGSCI